MDPKTITLHRGKHEHATPRLSVGTCWVLCTGGVPFAAITDQQRTALTTGEQVVTYHETPAPVEDHPFPEFAVEAAEGCEDWIMPTLRSDSSYSLVCGTAHYPSRTTFRASRREVRS